VQTRALARQCQDARMPVPQRTAARRVPGARVPVRLGTAFLLDCRLCMVPASGARPCSPVVQSCRPLFSSVLLPLMLGASSNL